MTDIRDIRDIREAYLSRVRRLAVLSDIERDPELAALLGRVADGSLSLAALERATRREMVALTQAEIDADPEIGGAS